MKKRIEIALTEMELHNILKESIEKVLKKVSVPSTDAAMQYIRNNKTWSDEEEQRALTLIDRRRCSIEYADHRIAAEINDLLDEFGTENGLQEGWWLDDMDVDEVFLNL